MGTFSGLGSRKVCAPAREPNGRHQREGTRIERAEKLEADVLAIAIAQPHRRGQKDPRSPLHGHALGRLLRAGVISREQYTALQWALWVTLRYMRHKLDVGMPRFPSILAREFVSEFEPDELPPPPKEIRLHEVEADMGEVDEALCTGFGLDYCEAKGLIMQVCVMDLDGLTELEAGTLRTAANRLARALDLRS